MPSDQDRERGKLDQFQQTFGDLAEFMSSNILSIRKML